MLEADRAFSRVAHLEERPLVAFDYETTTVAKDDSPPDPHLDRLEGTSFAWWGEDEEPEAHWVPLMGEGAPPMRPARKRLARILSGPERSFRVAHNAPFEAVFSLAQGLPIFDYDHICTMSAAFLLDENEPVGIDACAEREFGIGKLMEYREARKKGLNSPDFHAYGMIDSILALMLWRRYKPRLEAEGLLEYFFNVEMSMVPVIAEMEYWGIRIDQELLRDYQRRAQTQLDHYARQVAEKFSGVNPGSPEQVSAKLFDELGVPFPKKNAKKGANGFYSTSEHILEKVAHPLAALVLKYRKVKKFLSTYVEGYFKLLELNGRIRAHFRLCRAATGRLASSKPVNLQNQPRGDDPKQLDYGYRGIFIASEDCLLVGGDYSQEEPRIFAHLTNAVSLSRSFLNGEDPYEDIARVCGVPRQEAKRAFLTIVYGGGPGAVRSQSMPNRSYSFVEGFIAQVRKMHPEIAAFQAETLALLKKFGYVTTMFGRRRRFEIYSLDEHDEFAANNARVQGSAADILKLAMASIYRHIIEYRKKGGPESRSLWARVRLLLTVHDELIGEAPKPAVSEFSAIMKSCMEGVVKLSVPLIVGIKEGERWTDVK